MTEASTYQALRGHLGHLHLGAAAEALPGLLERAKAERWSTTALLEQLFALEVAAADARRHATLARLACLPAPWRISDFDFEAQPSVDKKLVTELESLRFLDDATNILLIGPPGSGQDNALYRARLGRHRRRLQGPLHHGRRPGGPLPQGRPGGALGEHDELLLVPEAPHNRRARLPPAAR